MQLYSSVGNSWLFHYLFIYFFGYFHYGHPFYHVDPVICNLFPNHIMYMYYVYIIDTFFQKANSIFKLSLVFVYYQPKIRALCL